MHEEFGAQNIDRLTNVTFQILLRKDLMTEHPHCPLCKSEEHEYCFSERGYKLLTCKSCNLFYINPYPEITEVHDRVPSYNYDHLDILKPELHYQASVQFQSRYFDLITQSIENAKSVLDVGCGTGHFLERLGQKNSQIYRVGIELNQERADFARTKANCDVFQIPVELFDQKARFDAITMLNVLSHIPNIENLFEKIREILTKDGKLVLKVGEMKNTVQKGDVFDWQLPDHLHFLGLNTINYICQKFNFKVYQHHREPLSKEMFSPMYFQAPGRSKVRNGIKYFIASIPFALPTLAKIYDMQTGQRIYSSLIVLQKED